MKNRRLPSLLWILAALPARADGPARVELSLKNPLTLDIRSAERPVVPSKLETPGAQIPGATLTPGEIPALPDSFVADPHPVAPQTIIDAVSAPVVPASEGKVSLGGPEKAVSDRAAEPTVLASLQGLALSNGERAPEQFDRYKPTVTTSFTGDGSAPSDAGPRRPRGVTSIDVNVVHGPEDVVKLIPPGVYSDNLKAQLIQHVDTMAPYTIYTYHDSKGGTFTGIDLSRNPKLIEVLPEQRSHEIALIKKIQVWHNDLQVLVRETGKTPDLVVGGVVTELKSLIGNEVDFTYLVNKANNQVHEHAERHALGNGAVVIDLTVEPGFTPALESKVAKDLDLWRHMPVGYKIPGYYAGPRIKKQPIALDKVYVFAGSELRMFTRHADDSYKLAELKVVPFALAGDLPGYKRHQLFLSRPGLGRAPPQQQKTQTTSSRAFDHIFLIKELRAMAEKNRVKRAYEVWREFELNSSPAEVQKVRQQIKDIWPKIKQGQQKSNGR